MGCNTLLVFGGKCSISIALSLWLSTVVTAVVYEHKHLVVLKLIFLVEFPYVLFKKILGYPCLGVFLIPYRLNPFKTSRMLLLAYGTDGLECFEHPVAQPRGKKKLAE